MNPKNNRAHTLTGKRPDSKSGDSGSSPDGLEIQRFIEGQIQTLSSLLESAKTATEVTLFERDLAHYRFLRHSWHILSDPDWQAWLEKSRSARLEEEFEFDGHGEERWWNAERLYNAGFYVGDRVKVTLELVES